MFGLDASMVYYILKRDGVQVRQKQKTDFVERFGLRFYWCASGSYYRCSTGERESLARVTWAHHFGPIPEGYAVDTNGDKYANPENLRILPRKKLASISAVRNGKEGRYEPNEIGTIHEWNQRGKKVKFVKTEHGWRSLEAVQAGTPKGKNFVTYKGTPTTRAASSIMLARAYPPEFLPVVEMIAELNERAKNGNENGN
jgi:hypothetical protein